jgi:hypothetical protein
MRVGFPKAGLPPLCFAQPIPGALSPKFLRAQWFTDTNASLLRDELRALIMQLMVDQADP